MSVFYLMRKDNPVCEINVRAVGKNKVSVELARVIDEKRMPLAMQIEPDIASYLVRRLAPIMYGKLGFVVEHNGEPLAASLESIIDYTGGFSLIDDFWLTRKDGSLITWDGYNLFSNEIDEKVASISFTGDGTYDAPGFIRSPEFTTDGNVDKAWRKIDGETYLYKAGLPWEGPFGTEQFSEFYAAQIAERLNLDYVDYSLEMWMGRLCSVCKLFTSKNLSYIAAQNVYLDVDHYIRSLDSGSKLYQQIADIILFDSLAINTRHLGNFGFIQDNDTLDIIGVSPIFDNGMALFGNVPDKNLTNPGCKSLYYILSNVKFAITQPDEIKALLTERQRNLAGEMAGFRFKRHSEYNLNDGRLEMLESIIHSRAEFLSKP